MILKQISDIYKQKEVDGELVEYLFKSGVVTLKYIESPNDIVGVDQMLNAKGVPYKSKCIVSLSSGEQIVVKHKFEDIIKTKENLKIKGFYGRD